MSLNRLNNLERNIHFTIWIFKSSHLHTLYPHSALSVVIKGFIHVRIIRVYKVLRNHNKEKSYTFPNWSQRQFIQFSYELWRKLPLTGLRHLLNKWACNKRHWNWRITSLAIDFTQYNGSWKLLKIIARNKFPVHFWLYPIKIITIVRLQRKNLSSF